ncbi:hypothetical protein B0H13DRAFT_1961897, partial [Mycena leptocephala]
GIPFTAAARLRLALDGTAASSVVGLVLVLLGGRALFSLQVGGDGSSNGPTREPVACKVRALGFSFSAPTVTVRGRDAI